MARPFRDIVDIKLKVKNKELEFYLLDGNIYCKNNKTQEIIIVGSYQEIVINSQEMIIREKGLSKQVGYTLNDRFICP